MDNGQFISTATAERTTFEELASRFSTEFAPHHYRDREWPRFLRHLVNRLGQYNLSAITPQLVAKYRDQRQQDPDPRYKDPAAAPRISGSTVKKEIELLSKVLDVADKEFGIPLPGGNPVRNIRKPKQGPARERRLDAAEWDALERECKASGNNWLWTAVVLSVETAMRQGELLALEWRMVDRKRRIAMLEITKNGEARPVPLSSRALAALDGLPASIKGKVIPLQKQTLYRAFKNACKRAGIDNFTWHDLRHEALSRLAERGDFNMVEMAAVSGHKTLQMLKRYTHLQAENLARKLG
jgi:integrase